MPRGKVIDVKLSKLNSVATKLFVEAPNKVMDSTNRKLADTAKRIMVQLAPTETAPRLVPRPPSITLKASITIKPHKPFSYSVGPEKMVGSVYPLGMILEVGSVNRKIIYPVHAKYMRFFGKTQKPKKSRKKVEGASSTAKNIITYGKKRVVTNPTGISWKENLTILKKLKATKFGKEMPLSKGIKELKTGVVANTYEVRATSVRRGIIKPRRFVHSTYTYIKSKHKNAQVTFFKKVLDSV